MDIDKVDHCEETCAIYEVSHDAPEEEAIPDEEIERDYRGSNRDPQYDRYSSYGDQREEEDSEPGVRVRHHAEGRARIPNVNHVEVSWNDFKAAVERNVRGHQRLSHLIRHGHSQSNRHEDQEFSIT